MGNPSKLTLYVAAVAAGGNARTLVKTKLVISDRVRATLENRRPLLLEDLTFGEVENRYEGSVKPAASMLEAIDRIIYQVAPIRLAFLEMGLKLTFEVIFNDPHINNAYRGGFVDAWRKNDFSFKKVSTAKQPIKYAAQWATFDFLLRKNNGTVCYNADDTLREMVGSLKTKSRRKSDDNLNAFAGHSSNSFSDCAGSGGGFSAVSDATDEAIPGR